MKLFIREGRVLDPGQDIDEVLDLLIEDGMIAAIGRDLSIDLDNETDRMIDAAGLWVTPGLIDLHVHLREPGYEEKETILQGMKSAAAGGFTTICCMPNTSPVTDSPAKLRYVRDKARKDSLVHVLPIGAITKGQNGAVLTDMDAMAAVGACGFSEDGKTVANALLMKQALEKAAQLGLPIFAHCEDEMLVNKGVVNEGVASVRFRLPGISNESESTIIARDILISGGAKLHICHISTGASVAVLRAAKRSGVAVTAEVCPHHFTLCDEDITTDDGNYKMNPPLRAYDDVTQIRKALHDNIIEIIATDHAPHTENDKSRGLRGSAFGIVGLETAVGLCISELVEQHILTPLALIEKLTINPARVLGLPKGTLSIGSPGDVTIIDPATRYTVDPSLFYSKGRNTPFGGRELTGRAVYTIVDGRIVYERAPDEVSGDPKGRFYGARAE